MRTRRRRTVNTKGGKAAWTLSVFLGLTAVFLWAAPTAADDKPDQKTKEKHYALIFGTAYGPDDRPIYGVKVVIHPDGKKHPRWELYSDHRGEFAQRVPPGPGDYVATGVVEIVPVENAKPHKSRKKHLTAETKVHVAGEEERDFSLHLQ